MAAGQGHIARRGVLAGLAGLAAPRAMARTLRPGRFRLGLTPVFLDNDWRLLELMRAHFATVIGAEVSFVQRRTYKEVVALLLIGEIEAAWLCG